MDGWLERFYENAQTYKCYPTTGGNSILGHGSIWLSTHRKLIVPISKATSLSLPSWTDKACSIKRERGRRHPCFCLDRLWRPDVWAISFANAFIIAPAFVSLVMNGWPRATAVFGYLLIENLSFPFPKPLLYLFRHGRTIVCFFGLETLPDRTLRLKKPGS